ncbi:MAG: hypothetical protein EOO39_41100, partial [Cytophagaceae bacterium]
MLTTQSINLPTSWLDAGANAPFWETLAQTVLPPYVNTCRWFAGKARQQTGFSVKTVHTLPLYDGAVAYLLILEARYSEGIPENYLLPISFLDDRTVNTLSFQLADVPEKGRIGDVTIGKQTGLLIDAIYDERFREALFSAIYQNRTLPQTDGTLTFHRGNGLEEGDERLSSSVLPVDSSNSAMTFGDKYFLKLYRKLFQETNPEVDMVAFLTDESKFDHIPAFGNPDRYAFDVLESVLSGGRAARFFSSLVQSGLTSSAEAYDYGLRDPDLFTISATAQPGKTNAE